MTARIYLSSPDVGQAEMDACLRAIRSGWVTTMGAELDAFEAELAAYSERQHAVALSSGTAALHLALVEMGVGTGDLVLTSSMTFAATANAISYTGAVPIFIDCDQTGNMNPALLAEAYDVLHREGQQVKAVVPVDMVGKVVNHELIGEIAAHNGTPVISDAAESFGALHNGRSSASFGVAAVISFNGNKIMTTSGGGALLTDDADMAARVRYLAAQARQPGVHYEHTEIGFNYRMSNLLAGVGRAQLTRLDEMMERRRQHRLFYRELFQHVSGISIFGEPSGVDGGDTRDNFWLTCILIEPTVTGFTADDLRVALASWDIEARPLFKPMHLQPVFAQARAFTDGTSEQLFHTGLALPSGSALTEADLTRISESITHFLAGRRAA